MRGREEYNEREQCVNELKPILKEKYEKEMKPAFEMADLLEKKGFFDIL